MSQPHPIGVERLLARAAHAASGSAIHPAEILQRIATVAEAATHDGTGPNDIRLTLSTRDHAAFAPALAELTAEIRRVVIRAEHAGGGQPAGPLHIAIEADPAVADGAPGVVATFRDTTHRASRPLAGTTTRLVRHRGVTLRVDGQIIALTHTPFSIGRSADNDLVIPSLAVSRHHAVLDLAPGGTFVLTDLGSRNGLLTAAGPVFETPMTPGGQVVLGDVTIELEQNGRG